MSVLFLEFEGSERNARVQKLARTGAHVVASEPRWPAFFELAKKEKPYAIAIDFAQAPSHALETADYLAKSKETRDAKMYLLRVPADRVDIVTKRLPEGAIVTDEDLAARIADAEREAQERARQKKEAAAAARKSARVRVAGEKSAAAGQTASVRQARPAPAKSSARPGKRERRPEKKSASGKKKRTSGSTASRRARKR